jgi:hypothetical protein
MILRSDARRRITLPPETGTAPGETFELELLDDGRILLVPVVAVPKHQLWAWTQENRAAVAQSLKDPRPSATIAAQKDAARLTKRWTREG